MVAGDVEWLSSSGSKNTVLTTYYKLKAIKVNQAGSVRVKFALAVGSGVTLGTVYGRIYINGVGIGTTRSTSTTYAVTFVEDFTLNANDSVELWARCGVSNSQAIVTNFALCIASGQPTGSITLA
jgi:hypothetical protein